MKADTVKLLSSHVVAVIGSIGGPILLVYIFGNLNAIGGAEGFIALIAGWVGASFQFLYGSEIRTAAQRATEKAVGLSSSNPPAYEDPIDLDAEIGDVDPIPPAAPGNP